MGDRLGTAGAVGFFFFFFLSFWPSQPLYYARFVLLNHKKMRTVFFCTYTSYIAAAIPFTSAYGHTTLNAPVLVRSPKLSSVGPAQYLDG